MQCSVCSKKYSYELSYDKHMIDRHLIIPSKYLEEDPMGTIIKVANWYVGK